MVITVVKYGKYLAYKLVFVLQEIVLLCLNVFYEVNENERLLQCVACSSAFRLLESRFAILHRISNAGSLK